MAEDPRTYPRTIAEILEALDHITALAGSLRETIAQFETRDGTWPRTRPPLLPGSSGCPPEEPCDDDDPENKTVRS